MPFLADPTQEPASSWLQSPAVAFIGLVSGAISIIQAAIVVGKGMADKEGWRRKLTITFAILTIVANAVIAP